MLKQLQCKGTSGVLTVVRVLPEARDPRHVGLRARRRGAQQYAVAARHAVPAGVRHARPAARRSVQAAVVLDKQNLVEFLARFNYLAQQAVPSYCYIVSNKRFSLFSVGASYYQP